MHIHSLSRTLAFPLVVAFAAVMYFSFQPSYMQYSVLLIPITILIACLYLFNPQIDYWWLERNPIPLDPEDLRILETYSPFYQRLNEAERQTFNQRIFLFIKAKEFIAMGREQQSVPQDVKLLFSMLAIELTWKKDRKFLFANYDRIIFYKHPFPTPQHQFLHTYETFHEDGVMIVALDYFSMAIQNPKQYYHIGYHTLAEAYFKEYTDIDLPEIHDWGPLEHISQFKAKQVKEVLGYPSIDLMPVTINYYFTFRSAFREHLPQEAKVLDSIFVRSS